MSTNSTDTSMATIFEMQLANSYGAMCSAILLLIEYAITISDEVDLVWRKLHNGPSLLFMLNRLSSLLYVSGLIVTYLPNSQQVMCTSAGYIMFHIVAPSLPYLMWAVFSALRVYAITGRSKGIAILVFGLSSVVPIASLMIYWDVTLLKVSFVTKWEKTCTIVITDVSTNEPSGVGLAAYVCLMFADMIVLIVTWQKTYRAARESRALGLRTSIASRLLRDGTLYFLVATIAYGFQILSYTDVPVSLLPQSGILGSIFSAQNVVSIVISRFILSLQGFSKHTNTLNRELGISTSHADPSEMRFASSIVADMGGPLGGNPGIEELSVAQAGDEQDNIELEEVTDGPEPLSSRLEA